MKRILTAGDTGSSAHVAGGNAQMESALPARGRTVGYVLLAAVATGVAAQLAVPIPGTPVPVSVQDLVVMLIGVMLGPVAGTSAVITYLGLGAAGAPVFSNGHAGLIWLLGPTGGYLLAYPAACCVVGMAARGPHSRIRLFAGVILAQILIFGGGMLQLTVLTGQSIEAVLSLAFIPFIPGAVLKIAFVIAFAGAIRKWRAPADSA